MEIFSRLRVRPLGIALVASLALGACNRSEPEAAAELPVADSESLEYAQVVRPVIVRPPSASSQAPVVGPDTGEEPEQIASPDGDTIATGDDVQSSEVAAVPVERARPQPPVRSETPPPPAPEVSRTERVAAVPAPVESRRVSTAERARVDPRRDDPATSDARSLNRHGVGLINAGRPGQAIAPLQRAVAFAPRDPEIIGNLGYAYLLTGDNKTARNHFLRSLEISPARSATWLNLGQAYAELGARQSAVDAVLKGYDHSTRKDAVRAALREASAGRRHSPAWQEAAGQALAYIEGQ